MVWAPSHCLQTIHHHSRFIPSEFYRKQNKSPPGNEAYTGQIKAVFIEKTHIKSLGLHLWISGLVVMLSCASGLLRDGHIATD